MQNSMKSDQSTRKLDDADHYCQNKQNSSFFVQAIDLCFQSSNKRIVNNLNFHIRHGERVALVGLNGAGKSSLLKLLVGELPPTSGEIKVVDATPHDLETKAHLGYQASDMAALPVIAVKEYLEMVCQLKSVPKDLIDTYVKEAIAQWNLQAVINKQLSELSQGNLQKVAIAQAFVNKPKYLFLDEPTQALDPLEQERFVKNISNLDSSISCLFSSHHISEAVASSDKVLMLHQGKLIAMLDLKSEDEVWYLVANGSLNSIFEFETVAVIFQGESSSLLKTANMEDAGKIDLELQSISGVKRLGSSNEAIMPLFSLLANQEL